MLIVDLMYVTYIDLGGCVWVLCLYLCIQIHCKQCQKLIVKKPGDKHHLCSVCDHNRRYPPASETTTTNEIEPLFERNLSQGKQLTIEQRYSIITLHKLGNDVITISKLVPCNLHAVYYWLNYYRKYQHVNNLPKSGRKRKATDDITNQIISEAKATSPFNLEYMRHKQSHSEKVQCWGCFAANGMGEFQLFTDNLDGPLLKKILSQHLLSSANKLFGDNHWWYFQDNDPKHRSGVAKQWLFNQGIQCIDVPPYSGDLNPMENLWSDLNRRVESHFSQSVDELKHAIEIEWNNTSVLLLSKLVASMQKRCKAIVDNQGHKTKY
jgi:hypothetical protein